MEGGIEEPPLCGRIIGVTMKLGVLKEPADETRVAIVPTSMKKLLKAGFEVIVESGAGTLANYTRKDASRQKQLHEPGEELRAWKVEKPHFL